MSPPLARLAVSGVSGPCGVLIGSGQFGLPAAMSQVMSPADASSACHYPTSTGRPCRRKATCTDPIHGPVCRIHARLPHHSSPCLHPLHGGGSCPNKGTEDHPVYATVCKFHSVRASTTEDRSQRLTVRLTDAEQSTIAAVAELIGSTPSEVVRNAVMGVPMPEPPTPLVDASLHRELGRIGVNVNQIVNMMNKIWRAGGSSMEVIFEARNLRSEMEELLPLLRSIQRSIALAHGDDEP